MIFLQEGTYNRDLVRDALITKAKFANIYSVYASFIKAIRYSATNGLIDLLPIIDEFTKKLKFKCSFVQNHK